MPAAAPPFFDSSAPAAKIAGKLAIAVMWNSRVGYGAGIDQLPYPEADVAATARPSYAIRISGFTASRSA